MSWIRKSGAWIAPVAALAVLVAGGCATKKYVRGEVEAAEARSAERIEGVSTRVEAAETRLDDQGDQLDEQGAQMGEISKTAQDALDRAVAAGILAEGKFLYETVLTDDQVRFGFDRADLGEEAEAALDAFAAEIKSRNEDVYVEIQGHTDSTGSEEYNLDLGEARAESVRRYLSRQHGIALHRMGIISYGESEPIADNSTRDGRAQNRRVALVVLK